MVAQTPQAKFRVFISYSRSDLAFAEELVAGLVSEGTFAVSIDKHSIAAAEDWRQRLREIILANDTVVFVLSPDSIASEICGWEVEEARRLAKRIIPVIWRPVDFDRAPLGLSSLNAISFEGAGAVNALTKLITALNSDLDWLREHTRIQERAEEWKRHGRSAERLLRGAALAQSQQWLAQRPRSAPDPTSLQIAFLTASDAEESRAAHAEQRRMQELLAATKAAQSAEAARAEAAQRAVRRTVAGLAASLVFALGASGAAIYAYQMKLTADVLKLAAERQSQVIAESAREAEATRRAAEMSLATAQRRERDSLAAHWLSMLRQDFAARSISRPEQHRDILHIIRAARPDTVSATLGTLEKVASRRLITLEPGFSTDISDNDFLQTFANLIGRRGKYVALEWSANFFGRFMRWQPEQLGAIGTLLDLMLDPDSPQVFQRYRDDLPEKDKLLLEFSRDLFLSLANGDGRRLVPYLREPWFRQIIGFSAKEQPRTDSAAASAEVEPRGPLFSVINLSDLSNYINYRLRRPITDENPRISASELMAAQSNLLAFSKALADAMFITEPDIDPQLRTRIVQLGDFEWTFKLEYDFNDRSADEEQRAALQCGSPLVRYKHALWLHHDGKFDRAVAAYQGLQRNGRWHPTALYARAASLAALKLTDAVLDDIDSFADQWPGDTKTLSEMVAYRIQDLAKGEAPTTIEALAAWVEQRPGWAERVRRDAWLALVKVATEAGQKGLARTYADRAIAAGGKALTSVHGELSWYFVTGQMFEETIAAAEAALRLDETQTWVETNRAHALMFLGRTGEARALHKRFAGKKINNDEKLWDTAIAEDFAVFTTAGLHHPLMDEMRPSLPKVKEPRQPSVGATYDPGEVIRNGPDFYCRQLEEIKAQKKAEEQRLIAERKAKETEELERKLAESKEKSARTESVTDSGNFKIPDWLKSTLEKTEPKSPIAPKADAPSLSTGATLDAPKSPKP